jgi:hypothetical protein
MRLIASVLTAVVLASVGLGTAQAAAPSAVALPAKATLLADGSVRISMKVRCDDQQQAFEWSVGIRQGTTFGSSSAGPAAGLIPCNGRFHTVDVLVPGANGPFVPGPAEVQALVQLYDADQGSDVELADEAVVRLRR